MTNLMLNPERPTPDVGALKTALVGTVATPADEGWDDARRAWNLAVDQRPALVVHAESVDDVVATVEFAREHGLQVAPQGTGHAAAAMGSLADTVLLKTSALRGIEIDPDAQTARVEAGVIWIEVVQAAAKHGLAALAGSSPDVGVLGYTLGGGLSWLGRTHGLAANSVVAIEVVTADDAVVRADRETEPDLFWALRGGGGSFGIVTALEFRLYPVPEVYAGVMFWPIERASEVLHAWRELVAAGVPEELTTVGRLLRLPPFPDIPEPLRGRSFVIVESIYLGDEAEGAELIAPLRALGPELDTIATIPVDALASLHMDPEHPVPSVGNGVLLDEVTAETIEAVIAADAEPSPLLSVEIRHVGGALARASADHGALASIEAAFAVFVVGVAATPELGRAAGARAEAVIEALEPWAARQMYMNFAESQTDPRTLFSEQAYHRLRRVKAAYDPESRIRSNHPIDPA